MYPLLIMMLFCCHVRFQAGKFGVGKWISLHKWPWQFACSKIDPNEMDIFEVLCIPAPKPILTPHNQQHTLPETKRGVYSKISTISQSNKLIFQALSFSCCVTFREVLYHILLLFNFKAAEKNLAALGIPTVAARDDAMIAIPSKNIFHHGSQNDFFLHPQKFNIQ